MQLKLHVDVRIYCSSVPDVSKPNVDEIMSVIKNVQQFTQRPILLDLCSMCHKLQNEILAYRETRVIHASVEVVSEWTHSTGPRCTTIILEMFENTQVVIIKAGHTTSCQLWWIVQGFMSWCFCRSLFWGSTGEKKKFILLCFAFFPGNRVDSNVWTDWRL